MDQFKVGDRVLLLSNPYGTQGEIGVILGRLQDIYDIVSETSPKTGWVYFLHEFKSANSLKIREKLGVK